MRPSTDEWWIMMRKIAVLLALVVMCEAVGILGSIFTAPAISAWYVMLRKPTFTPPSWIFGPVWTILYALMGFAVYEAWNEGARKRRFHAAMAVFSAQLGLNLLWSFLFFGMRSPALGLACIAILWCAIVATIVLFKRISKTAAWAMVPYLMWVSFAVLLNLYIWMLN